MATFYIQYRVDSNTKQEEVQASSQHEAKNIIIEKYPNSKVSILNASPQNNKPSWYKG